MAIGYLIYGDVLIVVDLFSTHRDAMKPGEVRVLSHWKSLKKQIYEALSGRPWDEVIERIDREWRDSKEELNGKG